MPGCPQAVLRDGGSVVALTLPITNSHFSETPQNVASCLMPWREGGKVGGRCYPTLGQGQGQGQCQPAKGIRGDLSGCTEHPSHSRDSGTQGRRATAELEPLTQSCPAGWLVAPRTSSGDPVKELRLSFT